MHSWLAKFAALRATAGRNGRRSSRLLTALLCGVAILSAGCHRNNQQSGYGVAWLTLTTEPSDFSSYAVTLDYIQLTRNDGASVTAFQPSSGVRVDFTKLGDVAELLGSATIATGTYVSATIALDYTASTGNQVTVPVNGSPQALTVVNAAKTAPTTVSVTVVFDPANPLVITPTYATTDAQRLALEFHLAASTRSIDPTTSPMTLTAQPYVTAAIAPSDTKLVRVRGPLINSSLNLDTYTVYVRPFHDVVNSIGLLTLFNDAQTIYTINGSPYVGSAGINALSLTSAGTTATAAYTTFEPTKTPSAVAGIWHTKYVLAGSTIEDNFTQGLEGDVVARVGNTLTLRSSTLALQNGSFPTYNLTNAVVTVGPATVVTADGSASISGLNYNSIAVGQHIVARGIYTLPAGVVTIDSTATNSNAGSVRLVPTDVYGTIVAANNGSAMLDLLNIGVWPASSYTFTGNGVAPLDPTAFSVNTGGLTVADTTVGDALWISGSLSPFGSAPPDFVATTVNAEATEPATLEATWTAGTAAPFAPPPNAAGATIDLANAALSSAVLRLGPESIALRSLAASPLIVPQAEVLNAAGLPTFIPRFSIGDPTASTVAGTIPAIGINVYSVFATYLAAVQTALAAKTAIQFQANGTYDRASNTFSASSINVVL